GTEMAFGAEFLLVFLIMLVILRVSASHKEKGVSAALAVGGMVFLASLIGGPLSGGSLNPARSLAPAIWNGEYQGIWVYLTAPFLGATAAAVFHAALFEEGLRKILKRLDWH
ncbi:MAG: aquaporin, partial [Spirochaetia bacterium]|nr:aquaporin [Spirochaetia bacterium]